MKNLKKYSVVISYAVGLPIGILLIYLPVVLPSFLDRCGFMGTMMIIAFYGKGLLGLIISFLFILRIAGQNALVNISNNKSLLMSSFKYSLLVNTVIWFVFAFITIIDNLFNFENINLIAVFLAPFLFYIFYLVLTVFTYSWLICFLIKRKMDIEMLHI